MFAFLSSLFAWFDAWFNSLATFPFLFLFLIGTWLRYADFERDGLFKSRQQLKNAIDNLGFPPGRLVTPNVRAWHKEREVDPWLESRPVDPKPTPKSPGRPHKATDHP
jgi:hypothetical protein